GGETGAAKGTPILFVVTCSLPAHSGRLHSLDGAGHSVELFGHAGHLDRVAMADVDLDGVPEIVVGGFDGQRKEANLHLLHPPARRGAPAELEAEVFFPRTALNRRLADQNRVSRLTARPGYLQVSTLEWLDEDRHEVCYRLDSQLRASAWFCDPFPALRHRPAADCAQPAISESDEIAGLRGAVEVVRHGVTPAVGR
ncbi:MAG: hypothetical protein KGN36_06525, partial [Acidobacteriota bacterium]|nr:hypothetical protein [Acidobacteriota bacterium]